MKKLLPLLALLSATVIWGITLPLLKINLEVFPPFSLAFFRFLIAAIVSVSLSQLSGLKIRDYLHIGIYAIFGISINVGLLLFGLKDTQATDATLILSLTPIVTSVLAVWTIKEKISTLHAVGIVLAFLGILVYILHPIFFEGSKIQVNLMGDLLVFVSMLSAAIYTVGSKKLFESYTPLNVSAVSFLVGAVSFLPLTIIEFNKNPYWVAKISLFNILSLIFLGIFSAYLAYNLLEWSLSKLSVHLDQTISYLSSIISIIIATSFLGEKLDTIFPFSLLLVALGIYLVSPYHRLHKHLHGSHGI